MTPTALDDRRLLERCRSGDPDAFDVVYRRHRQAILTYLARRTATPETAADLTAETFTRALADVREGRSALPAVPSAWLFTIARNLLVDSLRRGEVESAARRRMALEPLVLDDRDIARINEAAASFDRFEAVAASLSAREWELLHARLVEDVPYADLAARLRCSEAVVRKRVSRAKSRVRAAMTRVATSDGRPT